MPADPSSNPIGTFTGWRTGRSIAPELDFALSAVQGNFLTDSSPSEYGLLLRSVPTAWRIELAGILPADHQWVSLLEPAAYLAGTLTCAEYAPATLPIRELTSVAALQAIQPGAKTGPDCAVRLAEEFSSQVAEAHIAAGFSPEEVQAVRQRIRRQTLLVTRILQGGDLASRFWMWLDRFFYQVYLPWRTTREAALQALEQQAAMALGSLQGNTPPDLSWVPAQNIMLHRPEMVSSVQSGRFPVFFWVSPFEIDSWGLYPAMAITSFTQPGAIFENFRAFTTRIASRAAALGDPTRLLILRLIRQAGMDNTEIASFLNISRPTVSVHAKILRESGLINTYAQGRSVRHTLNPDELRRLFDDLRRLLELPE